VDRPVRSLDQTSGKYRWLQAVIWGLIVVAAAAVFYGNLRFKDAVLSIGLEDDFFYYAQVARNLAFHGSSTFDGTHLTNGYHPLWLVVLTVVTKIFDTGGLLGCTSAFPIAMALETVQLGLVVAIAYFVFRIARLFCGFEVSCAVQLLGVTGSLMILRGGMEAGLTMAIAFGMLWYRLRPGFTWTRGTALLYGLLASSMVLSRLDTVLLLALLFFFDVLPQGKPKRVQMELCGFFLLGLLPIAFYLGVNQWIFGAMMPVSGTAKQLRNVHLLPSADAMSSFAGRLFNRKLPVYGICVVLTLMTPVMVWMRRRSAPNDCVGIVWAVLLFPLFQFLAVTTLSDWMIWPWYVYAWPIAAVFASIVLLPPPVAGKGMVWVALAALLFALDAAYLVHSSRPEDELTYLAGEDIATFAATHPGIYAMGDRAGAVGYLAKVPVVQLEGLMMGPDFLENIRLEKNLQEVLSAYQVKYYIATNATVDGAGCYSVQEPAHAGRDSPSMRALLCRQPVATFEHRGFVNQIFEMQ